MSILKIRTDFVTNSSSSSFIVAINRFETKENVDRSGVIKVTANDERSLAHLFEDIAEHLYGCNDIEELFYQYDGMETVYEECKSLIAERQSIGMTTFVDNNDEDELLDILYEAKFKIIDKLDC